MKFYRGTGVTQTGLLKATKGFSHLLVTSDVDFNDLSTEKITIEIQKKGTNKEIIKKAITLKDFIASATYGDAVITSGVTDKMAVLCPLTLNGGFVSLLEGEEIHIEVTGLTAAKTYGFYGLEVPTRGDKIIDFELKTMGSDETSKQFYLDDVHRLAVDRSASITDFIVTYANGVQCNYTPDEFSALAQSLDPLTSITGTGAVKTYYFEKIVMDIRAINSIEIRKDQGTAINMLVVRYL
jgi:hypothetical protein